MEKSFHLAIDRCPDYFRLGAPVVQCTKLQRLARHNVDLEFHEVREVPLASSSQLMYPSWHIVCCLLIPFPISWTHQVQEGETQVDDFVFYLWSLLIRDTACAWPSRTDAMPIASFPSES